MPVLKSIHIAQVHPEQQDSVELLDSMHRPRALKRTFSMDTVLKRTVSSTDSGNGKMGRAEDENTLNDGNYMWTFCSSNAYGAFIHVALQAGLWKAFTITLPVCAPLCFVVSSLLFSPIYRQYRVASFWGGYN